MRLSAVWSVTWRSLMILVLVLVLGLATFLVGLGSLPFAWALAPLAIAALAVALVRTAWRGRAGRDIATAIAAVLAAGLGVLVWAGSPPGHVLVSWHLDGIELPADARAVAAHRSGNTWCFDTCPTVSRTYRVEGAPGPVAAGMEAALRRSGLHVTHRDASGTTFSDGGEGDVHATATVLPAYRGPATEDGPHPEPVVGTSEITLTGRARQRW